MGFQITRLDIILTFLAIIFVIVIVFLQFTNGLPLTKEVDATYINGTLTATGILLGFLTASIISGGKFLRHIHFILVQGCFFLFILAIVNVTVAEVQGNPTLNEYLFLQIALIFTGIVAFVIIRRVSKVIRLQKPTEQ